MKKTAYLTDQDFENFLMRSEIRLKNQFFVLLVCSIICQFGIWCILLTDAQLSRFSCWFLVTISVLALVCLIGLGYCYYGARKQRLNYQKILREQQEEMNTLIDEIQAERSKKKRHWK